MRSSFKFKQFAIRDDKCSMKVGTDAVLLGSWVNVGYSENILDIGTGSGVIALMLAQRSEAQIMAIDIDDASIEQAKSNVSSSAWGNKISLSNKSLQEFCKDHPKKYNLVVTNPPYFSNALRSPKEKRNLAKHNDKLSYDELINGVKKLLDDYGRFGLILPENEHQVFKDKAVINGLFPLRTLSIYPKKGRAKKRVLSEYSFHRQCSVDNSNLIIRNDDDTFTEEYKNLTQDFYLEF